MVVRPLVLGLFVALGMLAGCAPRTPARRPLTVTPRTRTAESREPPACATLPAAVGGFRIGDDSSFGRAGTRCMDEGLEWTTLADGGVCSGTPERVGYPAAARIVACGLEVCAIQLRYDNFGGETALTQAVASLFSSLTERYGLDFEWVPDGARPCARVEGDEFACVLDGHGIVEMRWHVADPADGADACTRTTATIGLRAEGDRGTHDARVTITYYTAAARAIFASPAL